MTQFSDFKIEAETKGFDGDRINIDRIFNEPITVVDFRIKDTKYERNIEKGLTKCLHMSIIFKGEKRVVFTGSTVLMDMILKIPKEGFPFTTIIKKDYKSFIFT